MKCPWCPHEADSLDAHIREAHPNVSLPTGRTRDWMTHQSPTPLKPWYALWLALKAFVTGTAH